MKIVIAGAGQVGRHLAKMLSTGVNDIVVIDNDKDRLSLVRESADVLTIEGDITSLSTLKEAGVPTADLLVAVNPAADQNANIVCASLSKMLGCKRVTARINDEEYLIPENRTLFTRMGIDLIFYPEKIAAGEISDLLRRNSLSDALDFSRGKLSLSVFRLSEESPALDMNIIQLSQAMSDEGVHFRVIAIARGGRTIIPGPYEKFRYGDHVYIMARKEGLERLKNFLGKYDREVNSVVIIGGGRIAEILARELSEHVDKIKIVEKDRTLCEELSERLPAKVVIINGDGRDLDTLVDESVDTYDAVVAVTDSTEVNVLCCVAAKKLGAERTIAQIEDVEYISLVEDLGIDTVINKKLITASKIFKFTLGGSVRNVKYIGSTNAEVLEYVASAGSPITKKKIKDLHFPENAIIGGYIHAGDAHIAVGDSQISDYDRVVVFAFQSAISKVDKFFR